MSKLVEKAQKLAGKPIAAGTSDANQQPIRTYKLSEYMAARRENAENAELVELRSRVKKLTSDLAAAQAEVKSIRMSQVESLYAARGETFSLHMAAPFLAMSAQQFTAALKFASSEPVPVEQRSRSGLVDKASRITSPYR